MSMVAETGGITAFATMTFKLTGLSVIALLPLAITALGHIRLMEVIRL
jgi:hypothetical protein